MQVLKVGQMRAVRVFASAFPRLYQKLHFGFFDRGSFGDVARVWSKEDIAAGQEMYRGHMLPIVKMAVPQKVECLLDIGCGIGNYSVFLKDFASRVVAVDLIPSRIERARELHSFPNVEYHVADVRSMQFLTDSSVDVVHMMAVLLHLREPMKIEAIREIKRVLRPGGKIILWDVLADAEDGVVSTAPHVHQQSRRWLERQLAPLQLDVLADVPGKSNPKIMVAR